VYLILSHLYSRIFFSHLSGSSHCGDPLLIQVFFSSKCN
jgi:hypothetical protein